MNIAYFYMTGKGAALVEKLCSAACGPVYDKTTYKEGVEKQWHEADALVFVMASGIVVRTIAPYIRSKTTDPAVIVMDQEGRHVISLLSGHLGGANELALRLADVTGGEAVITTATDVARVPAMDVFAKDNGLKIENIHELKYISSDMVEGRPLTIHSMWPIRGNRPANVRVIYYDLKTKAELLENLKACEGNQVIVGLPSIHRELRDHEIGGHILYLTKRAYCLGSGCKKEMDAVAYDEAFDDFAKTQQLDAGDIGSLATIDLKKDEICMHTLAKKWDLKLHIFDKATIDTVDLSDASGKVIETSDFVKEITGVGSVSESCAYLGAGKGKILVGKTKYKGITFSLAIETEALTI